MSGSTVVIGAPWDNDHGGNSGSAYIFDAMSGEQRFKLNANDTALDDEFGISVAVGGAFTVVGARHNDENGNEAGAAYLFNTDTGKQLSKILPLDSGTVVDHFGRSVAIDGHTVVVGASHQFGAFSIGAAYVFDARTGQQSVKLSPDDNEVADRFGNAVSIYSQTAIVGSAYDSDNGSESGSAYLFDTATGEMLFKLLPEDGDAGDLFGISVDIDGSFAVVGAVRDSDSGSTVGSAYIFDVLSGQQLFKLLPDIGEHNDSFGGSVAISGNIVVVSASGDDDLGTNAGSAYLFDLRTGVQIEKIHSTDIASGDLFGTAVRASNIGIVVSAPFDDTVREDSGSAYLFMFPQCAADLNNDGTVDTADLGLLISQFGIIGSAHDINGDGVIDTADLGILISEFGTPCPGAP